MIDPMNKEAVRARLEDPAQRQAALAELGGWVLNTCLLAGTEARTAFSVAGLFVRGIANSYDPPPPPDPIGELLRGMPVLPRGRGRYERKKKPDGHVPSQPGPPGGEPPHD